MSFRYRDVNSTSKDTNANRSINNSPYKGEQSSGRSPLAHVQFSPVRFATSYGYSVPISQSTFPVIQNHQVIRAGQSYPHPNAIKTVVQAPVPIINPVLIDSGDNSGESEKLQMQVEMLMEHYRYVYELYDELMKGKAPEGPKEPGKPKIDQERRELF